MTPDDLIGRVPLDPLGADVPRRDVAVGVEHEDGVVRHAFHQEAESFFAAAQLFFVILALRQVAGDLGEADELAICISDRCNDDVCPEQRAVLPDAPALVFERSDFRCHLELVLGQAARERFGRIEAREMLADDLVSLVPLEALGARVPRENEPLRVKHEDRVVPNAFDR